MTNCKNCHHHHHLYKETSSSCVSITGCIIAPQLICSLHSLIFGSLPNPHTHHHPHTQERQQNETSLRSAYVLFIQKLSQKTPFFSPNCRFFFPQLRPNRNETAGKESANKHTFNIIRLLVKELQSGISICSMHSIASIDYRRNIKRTRIAD